MKLLTKSQHLTAAAVIMGVSILLSRVMGLVRDKVISWQFGAAPEADLYFAAFVVPDFINYLLAGGYVAITLIPLLAQRFEEDEQDAWRFFSTVYCWTWIAIAVLAGLAWLFASRLAPVAAPGFDGPQLERLAYFLRIILPAQIFFLPGACLSALLYLRRQFFIPALAPLVYNGAIILGGLLLPFEGMEGFCWGVVAGAALGAFILPWIVARRGGLRLEARLRHPLMKRFLSIALPLMLGQSVVMLSEQFVRIFGSLAGEGAVSLLSYARRIAQVPVGIVAQAAGVASYPFLARLLAQGDREAFDHTLRAALQGSLVVIIPLSAWMAAAAGPTLGFIFQGGRFGAEHTLASTPLLQIMLLAVPLWAIQQIVGRAFYAHGDTLTPALSGSAVTLASLPFFFWAAPRFGAAGVAWVTFAGVLAYALLILGIWLRRQGGTALSGIGRASLKCLVLSVPPCLCSWRSIFAVDFSALPSALAALGQIAVSLAVFVPLYLVLLRCFAPELLDPLRRWIWKKP
ncbi:MAG: murein biosynthesis integral membrane protein MurJ [Deltaproteobacteria bacterium]|jgi:putative peptidoglycan lipid II flippase|nr:murein biosynthesis integral membrane protein MurJ [Deltaproteobacteria bacterium]